MKFIFISSIILIASVTFSQLPSTDIPNYAHAEFKKIKKNGTYVFDVINNSSNRVFFHLHERYDEKGNLIFNKRFFWKNSINSFNYKTWIVWDDKGRIIEVVRKSTNSFFYKKSWKETFNYDTKMATSYYGSWGKWILFKENKFTDFPTVNSF